MKVSIIVAVYNIEKYVERCIKSIIAQTYADIEILLIDDGSTDSSGIICDCYAKRDYRVKVIHKENGGLSDARNTGLVNATGDYLCFVDGDDWIHKDIIRSLINIAKKNDADIVSCNYKIVDKYVKDIDYDDIKSIDYSDRKLHFYVNNLFSADQLEQPVWNKIYRKSLFDNIKFPTNQIYEDMYTNFLLLEKCRRFIKCNVIGYYYNQEGSSITRSGFSEKNLDLIKVCNQLLERVKLYNDIDLIVLCYALRAKSEVSLLIRLVGDVQGQNVKIRKCLIESLKKDKKYLKGNKKLKKEWAVAQIITLNWELFEFIVKIGYSKYKEYLVTK